MTIEGQAGSLPAAGRSTRTPGGRTPLSFVTELVKEVQEQAEA